MAKRHVLALLASLSAAASLPVAGGCGDDDSAADASDAATAPEGAAEAADICETYQRGQACSLPPGRVCFPQCATGGCFCENRLWTCRTDLSCMPDAPPLFDAGSQEDASTTDADLDAADASDAAHDAVDEAATDASDDAPADAPEDG